METDTFQVEEVDENVSYMFKKTFKVDLSRLFENEKSNALPNDAIKNDYINYFKSKTYLSIFDQCLFVLLWKIYAPLLTVEQLQQLEEFVRRDSRTFYLYFSYNIHNLINYPVKPTVIPRKKRQLPLTHKLTRLHNLVTVESEEFKNHKFLVNFILAQSKDG